MARFYITTPLYYINAKPHLGHAYTTIAADVLARWHRLKGSEVRFLTGLDEHGQKVLRVAEGQGLSPQDYADQMVPPFKDLWTRLGIQYDDFIRTTEPRHTRVVRDVLQRLYDADEIYADDYEGWYSTAAERFWTEKDLIDGKCPDTGQPVEWIKERNYFFRMSKYAEPLRQWIADHPDFLQPESRRSEVLGYLRSEVGDLCISRPKSRLSWGISMPFDEDYVTYVWFDALLNYITALGFHPDGSDPLVETFWPADVQLIGKDILITHAVYWSTMLFAVGLTPPRTLFAHGWWTVEGQKMSKTLGNVVDPNFLIDVYGAEPTRYFLLKEIPFGGDGNFSHDAFMIRFNADLANDFGNLAHRALSMTEKWLGGVVPAIQTAPTERDQELAATAQKALQDYTAQLEALQFSQAFESLWTLIRAGNKYIDSEEPWRLRKDDPARLAGVKRRCLEICRIAAVLLSPIMPDKSRELLGKLGMDAVRFEMLDSFDGLLEGAAVAAGDPLFPRLQELPAAVVETRAASLAQHAAEASQAPPKKAKKAAAPPPAAEETGLITIDDFKKVALRAGRVVAAAQHPNADRLLVLTVDLGEAQPRTIVAGIASRYSPEALVGKVVVAVANLRPAKMRGVESQGMLLAAGDAEVLGLVTLPEDVPPGTTVR